MQTIAEYQNVYPQFTRKEGVFIKKENKTHTRQDTEQHSVESPRQIYDRIFKRIFSLSDKAIIHLINGLFEKDFPPDSTVAYPNKEFVSSSLEDRLADVIVVINGIHVFHLEAQMKEDEMIVLRLRGLIDQWKKAKKENKFFDRDKFFRLQKKINDDIISSIELNLELENITADDARELFELTNRLYKHICRDFELLGGEENMKPLLPGALELPNDKYRFKIDELEKEIARYADENARYADENARYADEIIRYADENARYADENARYADENARLKKKIAELENQSMS